MDDQALILHVINSLGISGGAEQQLVANLRHFEHTGLRHAVAHLFSYDFETRNAEMPDGVEVHPLRAVGERRGRLGSIRRLDRLVGKHRPDLIHCSLADAALAARIVGAVRRIPVIESLVNISHEPIRCVDNPDVTRVKLRVHALVDRITMRSVRRFHALSRAVSESWQRVVGLPGNRISVIPRGIDVEQLTRAARGGPDRAELLHQIGLGPDAFLLLSVGRHEAQKGHRYAIEAMPEILSAVPAARLAIVGRPGNRTTDLERAVADLGLAESVRFLGRRRDVAALLAASDAFLFPSLFEGLGVALLEAMALGCACVVTQAPPMSDVVTHGESGLVFERGSPSELAAAVLTLHADPELRRRLGTAARQRVLADYRIHDTARRVEAMYCRELGLAARS